MVGPPGIKTASFFSFLLAAGIYRYHYSNLSFGNDIPLVQTKEATTLRHNVDVVFPPTPVVRAVIENKIYVAQGFALGNMIMIEGTDGIIIVDTTESGEIALKVLAEFRKITDKPLKGIVVTHFHTDHLYGAAALVEAEKHRGRIEVFMHATTLKEEAKFASSAPYALARAIRQFGVFLKHDREIDSGFGKGVVIKPGVENPIAQPTNTFQDREKYSLAGIDFELIHTPGETSDHISMWIPEWRAMMTADNVYECFPNLMTIRGSPPRDYRIWYRSLDLVREMRPQYMVPSHGNPVVGESQVYDVVTPYRDAIQFVYDQTIRRMNQRMPIDVIVDTVKLPPVLANHPYLSECYGQVSWCVRGVFSGQLGWFDGDPVNLNPLNKQKRANRLAELAANNFAPALSGVEKLLKMADQSFEKSSKQFNTTGDILIDELQWGLELSANALRVTEKGTTLYEAAKNMTILGLRLMGTSTVNNNGRNYYLTSANELEFDIKLEIPPSVIAKNIEKSSIKNLLDSIPFRLKTEWCKSNEVITVVFYFSDLDEKYTFTLRHCIVEYNAAPSLVPKQVDANLTLTSIAWKNVLTKKNSLAESVVSKALKIDGSVLLLRRFLTLVI